MRRLDYDFTVHCDPARWRRKPDVLVLVRPETRDALDRADPTVQAYLAAAGLAPAAPEGWVPAQDVTAYRRAVASLAKALPRFDLPPPDRAGFDLAAFLQAAQASLPGREARMPAMRPESSGAGAEFAKWGLIGAAFVALLYGGVYLGAEGVMAMVQQVSTMAIGTEAESAVAPR